MPFFQALETEPADRPEGRRAPTRRPARTTSSSRDIGRQITVKRNKFYKGSRPANADDDPDITVNTNLDQSLLQVKANQVDYDMGGLPATAHADLGAAVRRQQGERPVPTSNRWSRPTTSP